MENRDITVFFVSSYSVAFVLRDIEIIRKHFNIRVANFIGIKKTVRDALKTIIIIWKNLRKSDIAFIWFADFRAFVTVLFAKILRKRTVLVVGGYEVAKLPQFAYGGYSGIIRINRLMFMLYNTDRILTVSEYLQKEIQKLVPQKEITKIELGIDADTVNFIKEDVIITVGNAIDNIYKLKGLDTFAKSSLSFPDHNFVIIGNYDEKIRKEILQINPQITFTGKLEQKQVFEWLQKAKVYCQLSFVESFGVALLEAMSFGCVPVVTLRGAMPEIVGETGFYTEFGDVELTVNAIEKALISMKSSKAQKRVTEKFSLRNRETKLIKLIDNN